MRTTLPRPPSVPPGSPLATGWRARLVAMLEEHGLVDVLDTVSAFAELAVRREPDTAEDPLDDQRSLHLHQLLPGWFHQKKGRPTLNDAKPVTHRRVADPALRRIGAIEIPDNTRGRPKWEE